ncbi:MAG: hypothetical protein V4451_16220 [Pseudomonadota bacterium]
MIRRVCVLLPSSRARTIGAENKMPRSFIAHLQKKDHQQQVFSYSTLKTDRQNHGHDSSKQRPLDGGFSSAAWRLFNRRCVISGVLKCLVRRAGKHASVHLKIPG